MANRYGRDIGRRDRDYLRDEDEGRRSYGERSSSFNDDDERYFGGSRRYGEGYSGGSYGSFDTTDDRSYSGQGSRYGSDSERSRGQGRDYDRGRYGQGPGYSQGWGGTNTGDYRGYGGSEYYRGSSEGRGYGYGSNLGSTRSDSRWRGHGGEDVGRYRSAYGGYPSSEQGYMGGYDNDRDRGWWDRASDEVASWFGDEEAARRRRRDERSGGHRGRGPSGYTRSDDRISEDINDRLTDYDYIDATNVNVEVSGGDVTLSGTVDSRYEKRLAEDLAEAVSGVRNVENRLRVNSGSQWDTDSTNMSTDNTIGTKARGKSSSA